MPLLAKPDRLIVWLVPPVIPTVNRFVELLKAMESISCASVLIPDKSTVFVLPLLIPITRLFVFKLAIKV